MSIIETQRIQMDILRCFHSFCTEHALKYSLCAGTLLGAVRHHGFIPWDDDIDVYMPRSDYDVFASLCEKGLSNFPPHICFQDGHSGAFSFSHGKLADTRYHVELEFTEEKAADYIGIDVFPLDGVPENPVKKWLLYRHIMFLRRLLALAYAKPRKGKTKLRAAFKHILSEFVRLMDMHRLADRIDRLCRQYAMKDVSFAAPISSTIYGMREYIPSCDFERLTMLRFVDADFPVFPSYDEYLSRLYGNYMSVPDESNRKRHYLHITKSI